MNDVIYKLYSMFDNLGYRTLENINIQPGDTIYTIRLVNNVFKVVSHVVYTATYKNYGDIVISWKDKDGNVEGIYSFKRAFGSIFKNKVDAVRHLEKYQSLDNTTKEGMHLSNWVYYIHEESSYVLLKNTVYAISDVSNDVVKMSISDVDEAELNGENAAVIHCVDESGKVVRTFNTNNIGVRLFNNEDVAYIMLRDNMRAVYSEGEYYELYSQGKDFGVTSRGYYDKGTIEAVLKKVGIESTKIDEALEEFGKAPIVINRGIGDFFLNVGEVVYGFLHEDLDKGVIKFKIKSVSIDFDEYDEASLGDSVSFLLEDETGNLSMPFDLSDINVRLFYNEDIAKEALRVYKNYFECMSRKAKGIE